MPGMQAVYYRESDGTEPVRVFLNELEPEERAVLDLQIDRLNMLQDGDPPLPFPHSSQVEGDLRELRCHYGRRLYRVLYRRSRRLFVLLHVFRKNSEAVPAAEKAIAAVRWDDFQRRINEVPRRTTRPAGRDAP
jgi:phage-related protein